MSGKKQRLDTPGIRKLHFDLLALQGHVFLDYNQKLT